MLSFFSHYLRLTSARGLLLQAIQDEYPRMEREEAARNAMVLVGQKYQKLLYVSFVLDYTEKTVALEVQMVHEGPMTQPARPRTNPRGTPSTSASHSPSKFESWCCSPMSEDTHEHVCTVCVVGSCDDLNLTKKGNDGGAEGPLRREIRRQELILRVLAHLPHRLSCEHRAA